MSIKATITFPALERKLRGSGSPAPGSSSEALATVFPMGIVHEVTVPWQRSLGFPLNTSWQVG